MTVPVRIEDPRALVGQYIQQVRSKELYYVEAVGRAGMTCREVEAYGQTPAQSTPETCITWRAIKALYTIVVPIEQIEPGIKS